MRAPEVIEADPIEIPAIAQTDTIKLERIIAWCASHPDLIMFARDPPSDRHYKLSQTS